MQLNATHMPESGKKYTLTEEAVELLTTLLTNHQENLQRKGSPDDEFELELTDSLLTLFEDTD